MPDEGSVYDVVRPGIYRHNETGNYYQVMGTARDDATGAATVVYLGLYHHPERGYGAWTVRSVEDFVAIVEIGGREVPRFEWVGVPGEAKQ